MNFDHKMMKRCFKLALRAKGQTAPNPLVGSVIVKDGEIIAEGYHKKAGLPHAEADAFLNLKSSAEGAILYVNLEPCQHTDKRTPPCSREIIKHKIKKVVIANLDPNPKVSGKGVQELIDHGIEVQTGILKEEGRYLNRVFFHHIKNQTPYVHLKWAQTIDGYIADINGKSKWISNQKSREIVHGLRQEYDGILIGAGTLRTDNPSLTVRDGNQVLKCPKRIIVIGNSEVQKDLKILSDDFKENNILVFKSSHPQAAFLSEFDHIITENLNYQDLLNKLYLKGITSILIEGGAHIISDSIKKDLYQEISIFIGAKLLGQGKKCFESNFLMDNILSLDNPTITTLDNNIHINFIKE